MNKKPKIMYQGTVFETDSSTGLRKFIRHFRTNRRYKDQLFLRLFQDKGALLSLKGALQPFTTPSMILTIPIRLI